ncbi:MAG: DUF4105 domain-containing protein [Ignavibacteriales bacterium]|nr:DUF4105 domain-containing protein [Ignavibacteriales bacterium]
MKKRIVLVIFAILFSYNLNGFSIVSKAVESIAADDTLLNKQEWILFNEGLSFQQMYVVFAGPYPASPTSSFGHMFILLEPKKIKPFLLWDAIDFSANSTNVGSIEFFIKGIFGGLNGEYRISAFYEKLRQYTSFESRPLWLFPVKLNERESKNFLWNVFYSQNKSFPYSFSNKNCVSQIDLLIRSSISKPTASGRLFVFPHNILRDFAERLGEPIYIESMNKVVADNVLKLPAQGQLSKINCDKLSDVEAAVLLNKLEWEYSKVNLHLPESEENLLRELRVRVSLAKGNKFNTLNKYPKEFNIHSNMLLGVGLKQSIRNSSEYLFSYRFGLHEFFENSSVYPENDFLKLLEVEIGILKTRIKVNHFVLFEQKSLQPITSISNFLSWKIGLGMQQKFEYIKTPSVAGLFTFLGLTFPIYRNNLNVSFLINVEPVYLQDFGFTVLNSPEILSIWSLSNRLKWMSSIRTSVNSTANKKNNYYLANSIGYELSNQYNLLFVNTYSEHENSFALKLFYYVN